MNKQKYLAELAGLLSFLSEEDRVSVMDYYTKKFDAAGENGESALIDELGTPMRLAISLNRMGIDAIIAGDEAEKESEEPTEDEEVPEVEAADAGEAPAEEPAADAGETAEEAAEAPEVPEAPETAEPEKEKVEAAELIRAVMEETPEAEDSEEPGGETVEEAAELAAEAETPEVPEEAEAEEAPAAEPAAEADESYHESFPELAGALGKKLPEPENKPAVKLSIAGAIAFWLLMIVPGLPLLVLSVAVAPLLLAIPVALGWVGAVALGAGLATLMYVPDAMFLFGIALLAIGAALLLLLLALRVIAAIVSAWKNGVSGLWNRLARKEC
ncbi:MAG: HAAS signaling domain-containing protein [Candidatus Heteroscillospira sp.]|jgi:uncharacterized membrane protein